MDNLVNAIESCLNPFDNSLPKDKLFRLTGGAAVSDDIAGELVNFLTTGQKWCDEFIQECKLRPERFEEPIARKKVRNVEGNLIVFNIRGSRYVRRTKFPPTLQ